MLLESPLLLKYVNDAIHSGTFVGENTNAVYTFLVLLSAKAEYPLNLRPSGRSSTGKTETVMQVKNLFPDDFIEVLVGASGKSIFYSLGKKIGKNEFEVELSNRCILLLEEGENKEFVQAIKPLLSHDAKKSVYTTVMGQRTLRTVKFHLKGWFSYIGLTASSLRGEEEDTRATIITPGYGEEKYKAVIMRYGEWRSNFDEFVLGNDRRGECAVIAEAVKQLRPYRVFNPFAKQLALSFPGRKARSMRDFKQFLSLIDVLTMLHQYQRPYVLVNDEKLLISTLADVKVAVKIAERVYSETLVGLESDVRQFYDFLCTSFPDKEATYKDLQEAYEQCFKEHIPRTTLRRRYVEKLVDGGFMDKDESKKPYSFTIIKKNLDHLAKLMVVNPEEFISEIEELMRRVEIDHQMQCYNKIIFVPNEDLAKRVIEDAPKEVLTIFDGDTKYMQNVLVVNPIAERREEENENKARRIDNHEFGQVVKEIERGRCELCGNVAYLECEVEINCRRCLCCRRCAEQVWNGDRSGG